MSVTSFKKCTAVAGISARPSGCAIYCVRPLIARHPDFPTIGEAVDLTTVPRDQGGWSLRFNRGADVVRLVDELSEGGNR